jgi:hypothetical protein
MTHATTWINVLKQKQQIHCDTTWESTKTNEQSPDPDLAEVARLWPYAASFGEFGGYYGHF